MHYRFVVVTALVNTPEHERPDFCMEWNNPDEIDLWQHRGSLSDAVKTFVVEGVDVWERSTHRFPIFVEARESGLKFVVKTGEYSHSFPEKFVFWKSTPDKWECQEVWSENQVGHDRVIHREIHCGSTGFSALYQAVLPKLRRLLEREHTKEAVFA